MPEEILNKPILNKAERRRVLNFKIIRRSKHYGERDKEEQNTYYWIETALGIVFHHGFSALSVYPFNPAESGNYDDRPSDYQNYSIREKPVR